MRTMKIGKSGIVASVVGLGAWAIGGDSQWGASDDAESIRTIHRARDLGVTLIDTAPAYGLGHSEEVVGRALQGRRSDYVLSTKCGLRWDTAEGALMLERDGVRIVRNTRPDSIAVEIEASLRRLKTDYIDLYIVHWQSLPEFPCPLDETMGFLTDLKQQGKIRAIGASNLSPEQFVEYTQVGQLDLIQEKYSLLDRGAEERFFKLCADNEVAFQAYSPLERGMLTGRIKPDTEVAITLAKSKIKWFLPENRPRLEALAGQWEPLCRKYGCTMAQLVIAWTTAQGDGAQVNALCGARKLHQIEENAPGGTILLDIDDCAQLRRDAEAVA